MKPGLQVEQVIAILLECGYPTIPQKSEDLRRLWGEDWRAQALLANRCMLEQGFKEKYGDGPDAECRYYSLPGNRKYYTPAQLQTIDRACDPKTPVPTPSVEKRLNSPYCQTQWAKSYPQCQPVVIPDRSPARGNINVTVPSYPRVDQVTPQIQKDSNSRMNQMLPR